ncbi:hypothetical protein L484_018746 [Morus notabilis]|uniref:Uncharacterized protein n=1 Tax=Morus notabilis TaxID=981085 RepID=W9RPG8_9ROSA|nr:hypothetical protein L484_018746 [Morus notabilis]
MKEEQDHRSPRCQSGRGGPLCLARTSLDGLIDMRSRLSIYRVSQPGGNLWIEARYDSRLLRVVLIHVVRRWWWLEVRLLLLIARLQLLLEAQLVSPPDMLRERRDTRITADVVARINAGLEQCLLERSQACGVVLHQLNVQLSNQG